MSTARRPDAEILAEADEIAAWFENLDPSQVEQGPVSEYLLRRAARARAQCEREVDSAVRKARADGATWCRIGEILGLDEQEARETYGLVEAR